MPPSNTTTTATTTATTTTATATTTTASSTSSTVRTKQITWWARGAAWCDGDKQEHNKYKVPLREVPINRGVAQERNNNRMKFCTPVLK